VIIPWTAGALFDVIPRVVVHSMQRQAGKPLVIENVGGAGSMIGTQRAAKAAPDGYTILAASSSGLVIVPQLNQNAQYNLDSFEPIGMIGVSHYYIGVPASSPYRTLRDLIAAAKAKPDGLTYGTNGVGSNSHISVAAILNATNAEMRHVPYSSGASHVTALIAGEIDCAMVLGDMVPMAKEGRLRLLAVTSEERTAAAPDVPTIREALGLPGLESKVWAGLVAPKGTPAAHVAYLNGLVKNALREQSVSTALANAHFTPMSTTPGEMAELMRDEYERWGKVIKANNITLR